MSILGALKQQNGSIEELAKLPQAMIMQMAQKGDIREDMLAPILGKKAEMADAVARQRALQAGSAPVPTVLEQVMAKNAMGENPAPQQAPQMAQQAPQMEQAPMDGGLGQLPIPERQYAGGGIVAFDGGGMAMATDSDDDYEDYQQAQDDSEHLSMMDKLWSSLKHSYVGEKASRYLPQSSEKGIASAKRGSHPYEDMVVAEAKKLGVDPQLALHVLYKETGGLKNPESAKSKAGALGVMQLMPKTAKELGVNPNVPEENIHGGIKYLAKLGKMFDNDPRLVAAAYNAGPGNVRKHGGVPNFAETRNYVKGLAEGGIVGYAGGGMPLGLSPGEEDVTDLYPGQPKTQAEADYFQKWLERQDAARAASKAAAKDDTNLAMLTAGLRTMAGTSPYAFANIGAGGAAGVEAYGASKRARAAEQLAMDKMEIGALGAKTKQEQLNEYRTARLAEGKRASEAKLSQDKERSELLAEDKRNRGITTAQGRAAMNPIYKNAAKALENLDPSDPMYQYNVQVMQEIEDAYLKGRGIKVPTPPAKVEKPSWWESTFGGKSATPAPTQAPGRMQFDINGNPI